MAESMKPPRSTATTPDSSAGQSSSGSSPSDLQGDVSEQHSSLSPHRASETSDGYPSWLPKRPPPPAPGSTLQSSAPSEPFIGGRKPTPRSVRIISLQDSSQGERREPTDQTRVSNPLHARVWSRATGSAMSPTVFGSQNLSHVPRPKFRISALHLELLRSPSLRTRLQYYFLPFFVFAHIPIQTYFDFNAVYMLLQIAKFPNPQAPGVPGTGRNWALGAAAYIACWSAWIFVVFVVYEVVYSFFRRWRVKRPPIFPLYLSSSAFNFVSMTSYTNFCFMRYVRRSAFSGENGSLWDGIAETCWFYSQNLPTVALLLPRAGLCLALLLSFSSPQSSYVALIDTGANHRDGTFFRAADGTLTDYARGVLIANAAWTAWRTLVLLWSWIGLWVLSGQACAGLCGPRYRWEEDDAEKRASVYSDNASETDAIPWNWREGTQMRLQQAYDFCLTVRPPSRWGATKKEVSDATGELPQVAQSPAFEGIERVMAAVGFPSSPPPARRGLLSENLFQSPKEKSPPELSAIIPKVMKRSSKEKNMPGPSGPLMALPYPFATYTARVSSKDQVPFPPSPGPDDKHFASGESEDVDDDEEEEEEEEEEAVEGPEEPSSQSQGRTSGSMSSLGHPVSSLYPFHFRRPARGNSVSSAGASHLSPHSRSSPSTNSHSTRSSNSRSTESTGNQSSDSPRSPSGSSADPASPVSSGYGSHIPMPPRHPQPTRGRPRAGTVPSVLPSSPSPLGFPRPIGRPRACTRADSCATQTFGGPEPQPGDDDDEAFTDGEELMEQPIPEGPHEAAEGDDSVGLLSASPSPRPSFVGLGHRPSNLSRRSRGSRSDSQSGSSSSRSRRHSATGLSPRSRTQSLIQSIGVASRSSLELVQTTMRSRANSSMARLEEDPAYHSDAHSATGSGACSSNENYTFGQPLMPPRESAEHQVEVHVSRPDSPSQRSHSPSTSPSEGPSQRTVSPSRREQVAEPIGRPIPGGGRLAPNVGSQPDISSAAPSFVTDPATQEGTSESSQRTVSTFAGIGAWRPA